MSNLNKSYSTPNGLEGILPKPIEAAQAPTAANVKFPVGQIWLDTTGGKSYILNKKAAGAATWNQIDAGAVAGEDATFAGNVVLSSVATQLEMNGGAVTDFIGQATLVSGTVTIANTNIAANDRIFLTRADENSSTALGDLTITALTASTSFVITALDPADGSTTITGDVSKVNYFIVRQN